MWKNCSKHRANFYIMWFKRLLSVLMDLINIKIFVKTWKLLPSQFQNFTLYYIFHYVGLYLTFYKHETMYNVFLCILCFFFLILFFNFLVQHLSHIYYTISQTGKLYKVNKMVEGVSLLSHECVRLGLNNVHFFSMARQGCVQQSPRIYELLYSV